MNLASLALFALPMLVLAGAATAADQPAPQPLWPGGAPGAKGTEPQDIPTITYYRPPADKNTGAAIVICPGGGYGGLAPHEDRPIAEWLNTLGVAGVVLHYRLGPRYHHPVMLQDVSRAIRTVRANAGQFGIDPKRIGVLGFSAGGHLASTAETHFDDGNAGATDPIDRVSSRPDVAVLIYPVISMSPPYGHMGSRANLMGDNPSKDLIDLLSNEKQVTPRTPPTFIVHTYEDTVVPVENSLMFAEALRKAKVPFELHVFEKAEHGFGLGNPSIGAGAWPSLCATWFRARGFIK